MSKKIFWTFLIGLIVFAVGTDLYYTVYRPKAKAKEINKLECKFKTYGYNPSIAEDLVEGRRTGYWNIEITNLRDDSTFRFVYYTPDSCKIKYTISFWTTPKFYKYNINTQINILTNIYNVCKYDFQKECKIDNIYYKDKNMNCYCIDQLKFMRELIRCIKRHINCVNPINAIEYIDDSVIEDDPDNMDPSQLGLLGSIFMSTSEFTCEKVSKIPVDEDTTFINYDVLPTMDFRK